MSDDDLKPGCVRTLKDVARASGISYTSVRSWQVKPGFPVEDDGSYSLWQIAEWRVKTFDFHNSPAGGDSSGTSTAELKRRKLEADTAIAETDQKLKQLKFDSEAGKLVSREAVDRAVCTAFSTCRAQIETIPTKVIGWIPEEHRNQVFDDLRREVWQFLRKLAQGMNETPGADESIDIDAMTVPKDSELKA